MDAPYRPLVAREADACPNCGDPCEWLPVIAFGKRDPIGHLSSCCGAARVRNDTKYAR